jgi:putative acetyltransferase
MAAFAPARAIYASAGFRPCGPFADYGEVGTSVFLTLEL